MMGYRSCVCALALLLTACGADPPSRDPAGAPAIAAPAGNTDSAAKAGDPAWWRSAVFYQVFVRSFKDSDAGDLAGDGIGDLEGLISRLDYLNDGDPRTPTDLGVTGLWLTPINPSPSYHGYDVVDYRGVEPKLGTMEGVRRLVEECHKRGIRVILDLVLNHCSRRNAWFAGAADPATSTHDWFIWADSDPGYTGPWGQRVWHPVTHEGKRTYFYGVFGAHMPDLNFRSEVVSRELVDVARFWIDEKRGPGVDGYRLDAIRHLIEDGKLQENTSETHGWLRRLRAECKGVRGDALLIGEVWAASESAAAYVGDGRSELDMVFEFDLAGAMVEAARTGTAAPLERAQAKVDGLYPSAAYGRFLSNHDQTRVMTQLKENAGAMRAAAAVLLLGPGTPFIYYGEEIGMTGDKPDERLRTPMAWTSGRAGGFTSGEPWQAMGAGFERASVAAQTGDDGSLLGWYRRLIRVRGEHAALATGAMTVLECSRPEVFAFIREGERPALVMVNLSGVEVVGCEVGAGKSGLRGEYTGREVLHGDRQRVAVAAGAEGEFASLRPVARLGAHGASVLLLERRR